MSCYLVARHAPGGLAYLRDDGTWTRTRALGERFPLDLAAAIVSDYRRAGTAGVHVRNGWSNVITCRPSGRPLAIV